MIALGLLFAAAAFISSSGAQGLKGTDNQAEGIVSDLTGGSYHPWLEPVWRPDSNTEHLFFSLQAGIGGIIIGYFIGHRRTNTN